MKNKLLITGMVLAVAVSGFTACSNKPVFRSIEAGEAVKVAARKKVVILDVRTPAEFATGHLPGAVNMDIQAGSFATGIEALNKKKKYLVYCRSGMRSTKAVEMMKEKGFMHVTNMQGGITAWPGAIVKE